MDCAVDAKSKSKLSLIVVDVAPPYSIMQWAVVIV